MAAVPADDGPATGDDGDEPTGTGVPAEVLLLGPAAADEAAE